MKAAEQLRNELRQVAELRSFNALEGDELDKRLARLCREAQEHPDVEMAEAARLAGFKRRATAYAFAKRA